MTSTDAAPLPVTVADAEMARHVEHRILFIRGEKVLLDRDLARLYGVATGALSQAVRRNATRFPRDFMFQLTEEETAALRLPAATSRLKSQSLISKAGRGGRRHLPYAFTEQGVARLSSVLRVVFVAIRQLMARSEPRRRIGFQADG